MTGPVILVLAIVGVIALVLARALFFGASKSHKPGPENNWANESYLNVESKGKSHANKHAGAGDIWSGGND